jgi:hypothetical protein
LEYTGWSSSLWWDGSVFVQDPCKALKFSTKEQAEEYSKEFIKLKYDVIPTEHIFYN